MLYTPLRYKNTTPTFTVTIDDVKNGRPAAKKMNEEKEILWMNQLTELVADADVPGASPLLVVGPVGGDPPALAGPDDVVDARRRAGDEGRHHRREQQQREVALAPRHLINDLPALLDFSIDDSLKLIRFLGFVRTSSSLGWPEPHSPSFASTNARVEEMRS
jgi:hypothetical protein